jgi:hypothetical protein
MTCEECEQILLDGRNGAETSASMPGVSVLHLAKAHAQTCSACAVKVSEIGHLDDALHQLRISSVRMEAPDAIGATLLAEFRKRTERDGSRLNRRSRWRVAWTPAAVLLIIAVVIALYSASSLRNPTARSIAVVPHGHSGAERSVQKESSTIASGSIAMPDAGESMHNQSNAEPTVTVGSRGDVAKLVDLPRAKGKQHSSLQARDDSSLNGGGSIVRITLPLSSLTAMGLPIHADLSDPRVTADVWMDPFGAVVGIRLVPTKASAD